MAVGDSFLGDRVSFLIAAYNEEKHIAACVDSCLEQTHPHVEVSVTDDGSTDGTWQILQRRYASNPRVRLARFATNRGKVPAFNRAFANAAGPYYALIGADDVNFTDRAAVSLDFLQASASDLVAARPFFCDADLRPVSFALRDVRPSHFRLERILFDNFCYGGTFLFNRRLARRCFPVPDTLQFEDWWILFNAVLYGRAVYLDRPVMQYRQHGRNTVSGVDDRRLIQRIQKDFKRHFEYYRVFEKEIETTGRLTAGEKTRYQNLVRLNAVYRRLFLEDSLVARLTWLPEVIRRRARTPVFLLALAIMLFGNRLYCLKRAVIYKKFFRNGR
jgi:glycosyltransferase involved in cell wall biosynthesis